MLETVPQIWGLGGSKVTVSWSKVTHGTVSMSVWFCITFRVNPKTLHIFMRTEGRKLARNPVVARLSLWRLLFCKRLEWYLASCDITKEWFPFVFGSSQLGNDPVRKIRDYYVCGPESRVFGNRRTSCFYQLVVSS